MDFIFGFIATIILVFISSIHIFILGYYMKRYSKGTAWILTILGVVIYIFLCVFGQELDILDKNSHTIPVIAVILIYMNANMFIKDNEKISLISDETKENIKEKIVDSKATEYFMKGIFPNQSMPEHRFDNDEQ